jgi:hypothetical protein
MINPLELGGNSSVLPTNYSTPSDTVASDNDVPKPQVAQHITPAGVGGSVTSSREYSEFRRFIDQAGAQISTASILQAAKNFPTLARAFARMPQDWQFSKTELQEVIRTLESLDSNRNLKISADEVATKSQQFPELSTAFKRLAPGAQVSAAWVLSNMLAPPRITPVSPPLVR